MDRLFNFVINLLLNDNKVVVQAGPIINSDFLSEGIRDILYGLVSSGHLQYTAYREMMGHFYLWDETDKRTFTHPDAVIVQVDVSAAAMEISNYPRMRG